MGYNRRIKIRREVQCLMDALIQSLVQANFAPERIAPQASMAQYTTLRIGGPAEVMVNIHSADEIAVALRAAKQADAPVDIIVNGQLIARGEVVVIDDNFGVRITEIVNTRSIIGNGE